MEAQVAVKWASFMFLKMFSVPPFEVFFFDFQLTTLSETGSDLFSNEAPGKKYASIKEDWYLAVRKFAFILIAAVDNISS